MKVNQCLVLVLVSCLILSLFVPALEAASYRRNRARSRAGSARSRASSRLSSARRAQARALRQARARQAASEYQSFFAVALNPSLLCLCR